MDPNQPDEDVNISNLDEDDVQIDLEPQVEDQIDIDPDTEDILETEETETFTSRHSPQPTDPEVAPPSVEDELSSSGHMTHPEADDDLLENSHQVGLRQDETPENPKPLNMAHDVEQAERGKWDR